MADNDKPDFGNAGTVTIRKDKVGVSVDLTEGQYLFYRLTVQGGQPTFAWACKHKPRRTADSFTGHPKQVYEWTWCRGSSFEKDSDDDVYSVGMRFAGAVKYTLFVELRNEDDTPVKTVKDLDFESQDPLDSFTSTLRVFVE